MRLTLTMKSTEQLIRERNLQPMGKGQRFVDSEVIRLMTPFIPKESGELIRSFTHDSVIGSGLVKSYNPYSRRWHYEPANFQDAPIRGNYFFQRPIHGLGGKQQIYNGLKRLVGAT